MSWFNDKFFAEASGPLVIERVYKRFMPAAAGGGPPDTETMRAARSNIRYHLAYIGWLVRKRDWLAGDQPDLRRSGRGGAPVRRRLSGRCAVGRRRDSKSLVREDQVATLVPRAARRDAGGRAAVAELRQSRLLKRPRLQLSRPRLTEAAARAGLRRDRRRAAGCSPACGGAACAQFLADGAHGDMDWMERNADRRGEPRALWPEARTVIMLGVNYGPD